MSRLTYDFYNRNVVEVAKDLLGKKFIFNNQIGIITETEAYRASDDKASHAYRGVTPRNSIMFGPAGHIYVYMIYGMYYCINIVTEEVGQASAVLIRGLKLPTMHLNGPGKICRHFGITKQEYGINIITSECLYLQEGISFNNIITTPRIGINRAKEKLWRFIADPKEIETV